MMYGGGKGRERKARRKVCWGYERLKLEKEEEVGGRSKAVAEKNVRN